MASASLGRERKASYFLYMQLPREIKSGRAMLRPDRRRNHARRAKGGAVKRRNEDTGRRNYWCGSTDETTWTRGTRLENGRPFRARHQEEQRKNHQPVDCDPRHETHAGPLPALKMIPPSDSTAAGSFPFWLCLRFPLCRRSCGAVGCGSPTMVPGVRRLSLCSALPRRAHVGQPSFAESPIV